MEQTIGLTEKQAALLGTLTQQAEQVQRQAHHAAQLRDAALAALCFAHDLEGWTSFALAGRDLTVTFPPRTDDVS